MFSRLCVEESVGVTTSAVVEMTQPRNFSWFIEGRLAGMGYPKETDIPFLAQSGIKTLVNMTRDQYYNEVADANDVTVHEIYVPDFEAPSVQQIRDFMEIVDSSKEGEAVGVHCAMGRGRTGTMLACYLIAKEGYSAEAAIAETRKRRRCSIETRQQEKAVHKFEQSLKESED